MNTREKQKRLSRAFLKATGPVSAGLNQHNFRGLAKITLHAQLCLLTMLLTAQTAINTNKPGKARSIRYFAN